MSEVALKNELLKGLRADARVEQLKVVLGSDVERCHLVGGAVRDYALGLVPVELDIVVEGNALELVSKINGGEAQLHDRFLTATCRFDFGTVDFASSRTETYPAPGSLPEVKPDSLEADLTRRDFTINALTVPLGVETLGDWPAAAQGWSDLDLGVVRVLHENSFIDDPTRLWRAARYCGRLGFSLENATAALASEAVKNGAQSTVSPERIASELLRTTADIERSASLHAASQLGLLESLACTAMDFTRLQHAEEIIGSEKSLQRLRLGAMWWKSESCVEMAKELNLQSELLNVAAQSAMGSILEGALLDAERPSEIRVACAGWSEESVALAGASVSPDKARLWLDELSGIALPIDGDDLMALGMDEGPIVGVALEAALDHLLDDRSATRGQLLDVCIATATELGWSRAESS